MSDVFDLEPEDYAFSTQEASASQYPEVLSFLPVGVTRLLDAGCGAGDYGLRLAEHAARVIGVDMSPGMIELAKRRRLETSTSNAEFLVADLSALPFGDGSFDFVVSRNALHLTSMEATVPELRRVLRPQGRLFVHDLVTSHPRLRTLRSWQLLRTVMRVPGMLRSLGLRATGRIVRFRTSPAWLGHVTAGRVTTPERFRQICRRLLPGCEVRIRGDRVSVLWEAEGPGTEVQL
jgi:SAM-dependent methyltransferase